MTIIKNYTIDDIINWNLFHINNVENNKIKVFNRLRNTFIISIVVFFCIYSDSKIPSDKYAGGMLLFGISIYLLQVIIHKITIGQRIRKYYNSQKNIIKYFGEYKYEINHENIIIESKMTKSIYNYNVFISHYFIDNAVYLYLSNFQCIIIPVNDKSEDSLAFRNELMKYISHCV
jgi:hypothetical protein